MQNFDIRENHDELDEQESGISPTGEIRHGVSQVLRDIVTLGELQAELLQVDLRNLLAGRVIPTLTLALVAAVAALASLPILLASLAYYLVEVANLTLGSAFLASAGAGLFVAAICGGVAWQRFASRKDAFERSRTELARNVRWLKQVLGKPASMADRYESLAQRRPPR